MRMPRRCKKKTNKNAPLIYRERLRSAPIESQLKPTLAGNHPALFGSAQQPWVYSYTCLVLHK